MIIRWSAIWCDKIVVQYDGVSWVECDKQGVIK